MAASVTCFPSAKGSTVEMVREFISTKVSKDSWNSNSKFVLRHHKLADRRLSDQVQEVSRVVWDRLCRMKGTLELPILSEWQYNQLSASQKLQYKAVNTYGHQIMSEEEAWDNGCSPYEIVVEYHPTIS